MAPKLLLCVLFTTAVAACGPATGPAPVPPTQSADTPAEPPLIQSGQAMLHCTISAKENGTQKLQIVGGTGLDFEATVSPIVDGTVETRGPEKGGTYRFSSHLAAPASGVLSGVGPVAIVDLETKVNVEMNRYSQPSGPGTELTFTAGDIGQRGVYIEFSGHATDAAGARYAFRITMGAPGPGSGGSVKPDGAAVQAPIMSKMVMVQAPLTTVVTTAVTRLR